MYIEPGGTNHHVNVFQEKRFDAGFNKVMFFANLDIKSVSSKEDTRNATFLVDQEGLPSSGIYHIPISLHDANGPPSRALSCSENAF